MIRLIHCIRKREDLSLEDFRQYWQSPEFDLLIRRTATFFGARRYAKNATLAVDVNLWIVEERNVKVPFDGVIEYWWDNAAHLLSISHSSSARALRDDMVNFQMKFIDLENGHMFFTDGNVWTAREPGMTSP